MSRLSLLREAVFALETENKSFRLELSGKDPLLSIAKEHYVTTVDMHTGGEPLRIIEAGLPRLTGATLLLKRQQMIKQYDHYRKLLMHEPRGHFDMYGVVITEVDPEYRDSADFAVLFMHNEGYSSMCGHAVIALGRYAVDFGLVDVAKNRQKYKEYLAEYELNEDDAKCGLDENTAIVRIQCPCGIVTVFVEIDKVRQKSSGVVSFISAPGWCEHRACMIHLDPFGKIEIDIGYGGTYYAICSATRFNLNVRDSPIDELVNIASMITKQTVMKRITLSHPESKDLQFLYGTILTDGKNDASVASTNICVFADRQVDRCPTGSGVIARLAVDFAKNNIKIGQTRQFVGKTGSVFEGQIVKVLENHKGKENAIIAKVKGTAKYLGRSQWYLEQSDELGRGFLLK